MEVDKKMFEIWMERVMERFDIIDNRMKKQAQNRIDGELLLDNQDLCFLLKVSKRTLQRYRSLKKLPYKRIGQKMYYLESDVHKFIQDHFEG